MYYNVLQLYYKVKIQSKINLYWQKKNSLKQKIVLKLYIECAKFILVLKRWRIMKIRNLIKIKIKVSLVLNMFAFATI